MELAYTADDVRSAEAPLLAAGVPLMDRAAFALATHVLHVLRARSGSAHGTRVVVLVGAGNNGGDGLHAAALLARRGLGVTVVLAASRVHPGGLAAARAAGVDEVDLGRIGVPAAAGLALGADVVLDALVGTGGDGTGVRGEAGELVRALTAGRAAGSGPLVVAVDVPSGIGVDDGVVRGAVLPADVTVTFGAVKAGLLLPPARQLAGEVVPVDIGLDLSGARAVARRLEVGDVARLWPVPGSRAHKYTRGVLGLVAGTTQYPGAAVLAAGAAVGAGVGMVRFVDDDGGGDGGDGRGGSLARALLAASPEVVVGIGRVQAWAAGSGIGPLDGRRRAGLDLVLEAVAQGVPTVLDAGALPAVGARLGPHVVLTPHAGELAALLRAHGEDVDRAAVEAAPLAHARRAHELTGATVLLKGATTVVVGPDGAYAQSDAPPWLATAGAGDVLTGLLGALLAGCAEQVGARPELAGRLAAAAALVHGRAAHEANPGGPVSAGAVARALPLTIARVLAS